MPEGAPLTNKLLNIWSNDIMILYVVAAAVVVVFYIYVNANLIA